MASLTQIFSEKHCGLETEKIEDVFQIFSQCKKLMDTKNGSEISRASSQINYQPSGQNVDPDARGLSHLDSHLDELNENANRGSKRRSTIKRLNSYQRKRQKDHQMVLQQLEMQIKRLPEDVNLW